MKTSASYSPSITSETAEQPAEGLVYQSILTIEYNPDSVNKEITEAITGDLFLNIIGTYSNCKAGKIYINNPTGFEIRTNGVAVPQNYPASVVILYYENKNGTLLINCLNPETND